MTRSSWKEKLKAYFHDPPHKVIVSYYQRRKHELAAQDLLQKILGEDYELTDELYQKIKIADRLASAMCRLLVEQMKEKPDSGEGGEGLITIEKEIERELAKTGRVYWLDPWRSPPENPDAIPFLSQKEIKASQDALQSGERRGLRLRVPIIRSIKTIQKILRRTQPVVDFYELAFHLYFRMFPELLSNRINGKERYVMLEFPADTRAPNHSLFEHVAQTSALFRCLPNPGLLLFTLGPVQTFIAQARKTADLFAGSYLLSYLAWSGIQVIVENFGPDHLIYPSMFHQGLYDRFILLERFHGNPKLRSLLRRQPYPWHRLVRVPNLPNRFLAFIPFDETRPSTNAGDPVTKRIVQKVLDTWDFLVTVSLRLIHDLVTEPDDLKEDYDERIRRYLEAENRPEDLLDGLTDARRKWLEASRQQARELFRIHASALPLSLSSGVRHEKELFGQDAVNRILEEFQKFHDDPEGRHELVKLIRLLRDNPLYKEAGVSVALGYSLVTDLLERWHRASREDVSAFSSGEGQRGRLCSLCGERVELGTLWVQKGCLDDIKDVKGYENINRLSDERFWEKVTRPTVTGGLKGVPFLIRPRERLCAVCMTKRMFPRILEGILNHGLDKQRIWLRYFPSTREIAATKFKVSLLKNLIKESVEDEIHTRLRKLLQVLKQAREQFGIEYKTYCVPKLLYDLREIKKSDRSKWELLKRVAKVEAIWLGGDETLKQDLLESEVKETKRQAFEQWYEHEYRPAYNAFKEAYEKKYKKMPEASNYYALVIMDGDRMGEFLMGSRLKSVLDYLHPLARKRLESHPDVGELAKIRHPLIPAWQSALSRYLGEFGGQIVAKLFYEEEHAQVIYAGGDDVMFMAPVEDALRLARRIRDEFKRRVLKEGDMSAGIVFAHEKIPLRIVLEQAREAERSAKETRGRSAFEIRVIKRSGDMVKTGFKWEYSTADSVRVLTEFQQALVTGLLPSRFAYRLAELYHEGGLDNPQKPESEDQIHLAGSLLKFQASRVEEKSRKKEREQLIDRLEALLKVSNSPFDVMNALLAMTFVTRTATLEEET